MFVKAEVNFADGLDGWICLRLIWCGCIRGSSGNPCFNCHNPSLWEFHSGEVENPVEVRLEHLEQQLKEWKEDGIQFDGISLLGGEPMDQTEESVRDVMSICRKYYDGVPVILYTGHTEEEIFADKKRTQHPAFQVAEYIKCGPYIEELLTSEGDERMPKLASSNQNLYHKVTADGKTKYVKIR